jgi:hypothetical protein
MKFTGSARFSNQWFKLISERVAAGSRHAPGSTEYRNFKLILKIERFGERPMPQSRCVRKKSYVKKIRSPDLATLRLSFFHR